MFYFFLPTLVSYNGILILAAVIPAVFLMVQVYRSDRLEPESPSMLWRLIRAGILSSLLALVEERLLGGLLNLTVSQTSGLYVLSLFSFSLLLSKPTATTTVFAFSTTATSASGSSRKVHGYFLPRVASPSSIVTLFSSK